MVALKIKGLEAVNMGAGGIIIRIKGERNDCEAEHLSIEQVGDLKEWIDKWSEENKRFAGNSDLASRALKRTARTNTKKRKKSDDGESK